MNPWIELFAALATLDDFVFARWHLANGASPHMLLPRERRPDSRGGDFELPFPYEMLRRLEIPAHYEHGPQVRFDNDLTQIKARLDRVSDLRVTQTQDALIIEPVNIPSEVVL